MGVILERVNEAAHREREALWEESARRDRERQRQELDDERYLWHKGQAQRLKETMTALITRHQNEARKILEGRES